VRKEHATKVKKSKGKHDNGSVSQPQVAVNGSNADSDAENGGDSSNRINSSRGGLVASRSPVDDVDDSGGDDVL